MQKNIRHGETILWWGILSMHNFSPSWLPRSLYELINSNRNMIRDFIPGFWLCECFALTWKNLFFSAMMLPMSICLFTAIDRSLGLVTLPVPSSNGKPHTRRNIVDVFFCSLTGNLAGAYITIALSIWMKAMLWIMLIIGNSYTAYANLP